MGSTDSTNAEYVHLLADFAGVRESQLGDAPLLTGLLIAAAGGAGLVAIGAPLVRQRPDGGVAAVLVLERCHIAVHTIPSRGVLLLDILVCPPSDPRIVLDVFARRLPASAIRTEQRARG